MNQIILSLILLLSLTVSARRLLQESTFANADCNGSRLFSFHADGNERDIFNLMDDMFVLDAAGTVEITITNPPDPGELNCAAFQFKSAAVQPITGDIYVAVRTGSNAGCPVFLGVIGPPGLWNNDLTLIGEIITVPEGEQPREITGLTFDCRGNLFGITQFTGGPQPDLFQIDITDASTQLIAEQPGGCGNTLGCADILLYDYDNDIRYRISSNREFGGTAPNNLLFEINSDGTSTETPITITDENNYCVGVAGNNASIRAGTYIGGGLAILSCGLTNPPTDSNIVLFDIETGEIIQLLGTRDNTNAGESTGLSAGLIPTNGTQSFCMTPSCLDNDCPDDSDSDSDSPSSESSESSESLSDSDDDDDNLADLALFDDDGDDDDESDEISLAFLDHSDKDHDFIGYTDSNNNNNNNKNHRDLTISISTTTLINLWSVIIISLSVIITCCWCFHKKNQPKPTIVRSTPLP